MSKFKRFMSLALVAVLTFGMIPNSRATESDSNVIVSSDNEEVTFGVESPQNTSGEVVSDADTEALFESEMPDLSEPVETATEETKSESAEVPQPSSEAVTKETSPAETVSSVTSSKPSETEESEPVPDTTIEESTQGVNPTETTVPEVAVPETTEPSDPVDVTESTDATSPDEKDWANASREELVDEVYRRASVNGQSPMYLPKEYLERAISELKGEPYVSDEVDGFEVRLATYASIAPIRRNSHLYGKTYYPIYWKNRGDWQQWGKRTAWVQQVVYFDMSDGSTGYCIEPYVSTVHLNTNRMPISWDSITSHWHEKYPDAAPEGYESEKRQGVALAMAYGAPNNGDTSEAGKYATATVVWEMATGIRRPDGSMRSPDSPFADSLRSSYSSSYSKYEEIVSAIKNHGVVPSFAVSGSSGHSSNTYTMQYDSGSGLYKLSLYDNNGILSRFEYSSIPGVSFSRSGNTLYITATKEAAKQMASGVDVSGRGSAPVGQDSCIVWSETSYSDGQTQLISTLREPVDPVPSGFYLKTEPAEEHFTLRKSFDASSSVLNAISDNSLYSLEGAEYEVYLSGTYWETLTTDSSGNATSYYTYPVGSTVTIRETAAPSGCMVNSTEYSLTIRAGSNEIHVTDPPVFDPAPLKFSKVDKITGKPQGNASFEGAIFCIDYYDNFSTLGAPIKTWYFKTNARGFLAYEDAFLAPGYGSDPLYRNEHGDPTLPLGSVQVTEIVAPEGYSLLPRLYAKIYQPSNGSFARFEWTSKSLEVVKGHDGNYTADEPNDIHNFGKIILDKVDSVTGTTPQGDATLEGAKYEVVNNSKNPVAIGGKIANPGEVCYTFTTDANGHFESDKIFPIGSYTIREVAPPNGYTLNSSVIKSSAPASETLKMHEDADSKSFRATGGKWMQDSTGWWYKYEDGTYPTNTFEQIDGYWYYFNGSGYMVTGWQSDGGYYYYLDPDASPRGHMVTGWKFIQGEWYYLDPIEHPIGHMVTDWKLIDGKYYYFNSKGHMLKGWQTIGGNTYYLTYSGDMVTGWNFIDSHWYYFDKNGHMLSGHQVIEGNDYDFNADGSLADVLWTQSFEISKSNTEQAFTVANGNACPNVPIYGEMKIVKQDTDFGSTTSSNEPLEGIKFDIINASRNPVVVGGISYANGDKIATVPVKWDGTQWSATVTLPYGTYTVKEVEYKPGMANDYYELDTTVHTVQIREQGVTVEAIHKNPIAPGKVEIEKVDTYKNPIANAKIALQWSTDNTNWNNVTSSNKIIKGGCTSPNLTSDGCLITDGSGKIEFTGLYPTLYYRVVEVETPDGYTLLSEPVYLGKLNPDASLTAGIRIVNSTAFVLPMTGSNELVFMGMTASILAMMSVVAFACFNKKRKKG